MSKKKIMLIKRVEKALTKLPKSIRYAFFTLAKEIEEKGAL